MNTRYSYRVEWSSEDEAYVTRCVGLPSLAAHGETPGASLTEIEQVTQEAVASIIEDGEIPPESLGEMDFKGNILSRTSRDVHRELAQ